MGNTKVNGVEYRIYTGLPSQKHLVNNKLFEMILPSSTTKTYNNSSDKDKADDNCISDAARKQYEQAYQKKAFVLVERLHELRKSIAEHIEILESDENVDASKSRDPKKFNKLLSQIKQSKLQTREARQMIPIDAEYVSKNESKASNCLKFRSKIDFDIFKQLSDKKNMCTLKYAFAFSEVACTYLNEIFQKDPKIIRDPQSLFIKLFKTFILSDKANSHPTVEALMVNLYQLGVPEEEKIKF